jgi:hypothetical protein
MATRNFYLLISFFFLVGCSTFSRKDCEIMNWEYEGKTSALKGQTISEGENYFDKECREKNEIIPDQKAFESGYRVGLKEFCSPEFAYQFGTTGAKYKGTCPVATEKPIVEKYQSGRMIFLEKKVSELESALSSAESEASSYKSQLSSCQSEVHSCPVCTN